LRYEVKFPTIARKIELLVTFKCGEIQ
jgi:hypothetical protein